MIKLAHRVAYRLYLGDFPPDICVLHKCDNPLCVNPEHLFLGTRADNTADMMQKGRNAKVAGELNPNRKLTEELAAQIRLAPGKHRDIAKEYGVTHTTIGDIKRGKIWRPET